MAHTTQSNSSEVLKSLYEADVALSGLNGALILATNPPTGPMALFNHITHAQERLKDFKHIYSRMADNRRVLTLYEIERKRKESKGEVFQRDWMLEAQIPELLKLDFECLYIFGNMLLDQVAYISCYALGDNRISFSEMARGLSNGHCKGNLKVLWTKFKKDICWLFAQVTLYRNTFVVHHERPWQRMYGHTIGGTDFNLESPSPPGWLNENKIEQEIKSLFHLTSESFRKLPENHWARNHPRQIVYSLVNNIENVNNHIERRKITDLASRYGFKSPTFQIVAHRIGNFVAQYVSSVKVHAISNKDRIILGMPT